MPWNTNPIAGLPELDPHKVASVANFTTRIEDYIPFDTAIRYLRATTPTSFHVAQALDAFHHDFTYIKVHKDVVVMSYNSTDNKFYYHTSHLSVLTKDLTKGKTEMMKMSDDIIKNPTKKRRRSS